MTVACVATDLSLVAGLAAPDDDVVCVAATGAPIAPLMRVDGARAIIWEDDAEHLAAHDGVLSSAAIVAAPHVQSAMRDAGCRVIVPFKTSRALEQFAAAHDLLVAAAPARMVRQIENKLELPKIAAEAGVRAPETVTVTFDADLAAAAAAGTVTLPAIAQGAVGFAGAGTSRYDDAAALAADIASGARSGIGKLAAVIDGSPVTVNGCVGVGSASDVVVGAVARQLTGVPECGDAPFGSCGNEWSLPLEAAAAQAVREVAARVGDVLAGRGFRGVYGVDAVVTAGGDVFLIEVNPRVTASLSLQTQLQRSAGAPTLFDAHLLAYADLFAGSGSGSGSRVGVGTATRPAPTVDDVRAAYAIDATPPHVAPAASVIIFARDAAANAADTPAAAAHPAELPTGVWDAATDRPVFARSAWQFADLAPGESLVLTPSHHRAVGPAQSLARIITRTPVAVDAGCRAITPTMASLVTGLRAQLTPA